MEEIKSPDLEEISGDESVEKIPEKKFFKGENSSEEGDEPKNSNKRPFESVIMTDIVQRRNRVKETSNVVTDRVGFIKAQTLGMSLSPIAINSAEVKRRVKVMTDTTLRVLDKYREIDNNEYQDFIKSKVKNKQILRVLHNFYLLNKSFAQKSMIFLLNSYDESGISRLFQEFYLEFDQNNDKKMQKEELEKCIELLAKDGYIGKDKMIVTLKEIGIDCSNTFSLFQEGNANKILNDETLNKLYKKVQTDQVAKVYDKNIDHVDFMKIAPIISIFFFEYISILFLRKRDLFNLYLGFPYTITPTGKAKFNPEGDSEGLYRIFISQLRGNTDINKPLLSYKDVAQALITFRSTGYSESLTMESLERIMKDAKEIMGVDPVSGKEERKFTMKELLPTLVCMIYREIVWNKSDYRKTIEKYDKKVQCYGCGLATKLNKKNLGKMLNDAFCNLPFPNYEQFIKGLDFILKRIIPTFVSPAAIYIAKKLMKTPDTIVTEQGYNGEIKVKFNIAYIVNYDDLFERLNYFTMKFQIKLMYVRLLFKNSYGNYKTGKRINSTILKYNMIMKSTDLFETGEPGKFGNFEEASLKLLKNEDPEELLRLDLERKELKKKKFLETLMAHDKIADERRRSKKNSVLIRKSSLKIVGPIQKSERKQKNIEKYKLAELQAEANRIDTNINRIEAEKMKELSRLRVSNAFPNTEDVTPEIVMNLIKNSKNQSKEVKNLIEYMYNHWEALSFHDIQKFLVAEHLKKKNRVEDAEIIMKTPTKYKLKNLYEEQEKEIMKKKPTIFEYKRSQSLEKNFKLNIEENTEIKENSESLVSKVSINSKISEKTENLTETKEEDWEANFDFEDFEEKYFKDFSQKKKDEVLKFKNKPLKNKDEDKDRGCECIVF